MLSVFRGCRVATIRKGRSSLSTPQTRHFSAGRPVLQSLRTFARYTTYAGLSTVGGVVVFGGLLFIHDIFTYADQHVARVPRSPLTLQPQNGGPKNLPVVKTDLGDEDDDTRRAISERPRLVIVGGGWGVRLLACSGG